MAAIRIILVDDHTLFRRGLVGLLSNEPGLEVAGQAGNGAEALRLAQQLQFDIALMDVKMPGDDGIAVTRLLLETQPTARIIVLTVSEDDEDVFGAIQAGARGYLLKNADADELLETICQVHAGQAVLAPVVTLRVLEALRGQTSHPAWDSALTAREHDVLRLLTQGVDNHQISAALSISENTVKTHVAHILEKLNLRSRRQVATHIGLTPSRWENRSRP